MRFFAWIMLSAMVVGCASADRPASASKETLPWWKGNLHTHTFWSDGDDFPEMVTDWYKQRGYHFLALSDHNLLSEGEKWVPRSKVDSAGREDTFDQQPRSSTRLVPRPKRAGLDTAVRQGRELSRTSEELARAS